MRVAIIGLGGLGGPAARGLAAAGVPLSLFDGDAIEMHNLPRQTLFRDRDLGAPKASAGARRLRELFPAVDLVAHEARIEAGSLALLEGCGLWVDATDMLASKLFFSDQAVARRRTLIDGGAIRFGGQALAIVPGVGPCLRCLVEDGAEGETCQSAGILGSVVALLGAEMARLALRALRGEEVAGRYLAYDARQAELRSGVLPPRQGCEVCGGLFLRAAAGELEMLAPAQVQRFVRQILIPEVGRDGQERWLESRLRVYGAGAAVDAAVELMAAAGVAIERAPATPVAPAAVLAQLGPLLLSDTAFVDERSACRECLAAFFAAQPAPSPMESAAVAFATGAAVAGEALQQLLDPQRPPIAMAFTPEAHRATASRRGCACFTSSQALAEPALVLGA